MKMQVDIRRTNGDLQFKAENEIGRSVMLDGGDSREGMRPMELLLSALGSCAAFDVVHILQKQRQPLEDIHVNVVGTRPEDGEPKPFDSVEMRFTLTGSLDAEKAERAVSLSVEKYCSVGATLRPETEVTYTVEILRTTSA